MENMRNFAADRVGSQGIGVGEHESDVRSIRNPEGGGVGGGDPWGQKNIKI
jgi:hypothetical protein